MGLQAAITCIYEIKLGRSCPALQQQIENPVWSNQSLLILRMTSFPWLPLWQLGLRMIGVDNSMSTKSPGKCLYCWEEHTEWRLALVNIYTTWILLYLLHIWEDVSLCFPGKSLSCYAHSNLPHTCVWMRWCLLWIGFLSHSQPRCWVIKTIQLLRPFENAAAAYQLFISCYILPCQSQHPCNNHDLLTRIVVNSILPSGC